MTEIAPGIFGLTQSSATAAAAARLGVQQARAFCTDQGMEFEVVRSVIGHNDYQIAFRCPRPVPGWLTPPDQDATSPGFRPQAGLQ